MKNGTIALNKTNRNSLTSCALLAIVMGIGLLAAAPSAEAVEVDDISAFYIPLADSREELNAHVNSLLEKAVMESTSCDLRQFEKKILSLLTPSGAVQQVFFGGVELYAQKSPNIQRQLTPIKNSIYQGSPFERAVLVNMGEFIKLGGIFPSIRLHNQIVGTDKLSHFFETGHELYQDHLSGGRLTPQKLRDLVEASVALEDGHLGMDVTGIKSYADIHAHFQGALFWNEMLQPQGKWLACENNRLQLQKKFDFADVVHAGWSEAINCNEYTEGRGWGSILTLFQEPPLPYLAAIQKNTLALEIKNGRRYQCPIVEADCSAARDHLRAILPSDLEDTEVEKMMSPSCR